MEGPVGALEREVTAVKGKLIILEGTDGSGKSTQFQLLCRRMEREGRDFHRLVFPRYDQPSSMLLRMYLQGEFGSRPGDVNAYAASTFFAMDRFASWKQDWSGCYLGGGTVLSDRYTTSNAVHQGGKLAPEEQRDFFAWLADFEYGKLGLPEPDLVLWLDMPIHNAVANLRRRESETHTQADIHEVDEGYLRQCHAAAQAAAEFYGWRRVPCLDEKGDMRSIEDIHEEIWSAAERTLGSLT